MTDNSTEQADRLASAIAREIAWHGHMTDASIHASIAETHPRADAAYVIARGISLGLIREVPRLGGYVASRKVNAREFGERCAALLAGDLSA